MASSCEVIELRQQAHYWQAQHKDPIARESQLQAKVRSLEELVRCQEILIQEQSHQIEALTAKVAFLHDQALRTKMEAMVQVCDRQLVEEKLHPVARKTLESLRNHWKGLSIFVDRPEIPMDNNTSERLSVGIFPGMC